MAREGRHLAAQLYEGVLLTFFEGAALLGEVAAELVAVHWTVIDTNVYVSQV